MSVKITRKTAEDIQNIVVIAIVPVVETGKIKFLFVKEADGALRFPGGKVKVQESLMEALQRELLEETGLNSFKVNALAMIEHSILYDQENGEIEKSILLYFFLASFGEAQSMNEDQQFMWMDHQLVASQQRRVPYDNHLIINEMATISMNHRYRVPPGFLDSPKDERMVSFRTFCWIDQELQGTATWW